EQFDTSHLSSSSRYWPNRILSELSIQFRFYVSSRLGPSSGLPPDSRARVSPTAAKTSHATAATDATAVTQEGPDAAQGQIATTALHTPASIDRGHRTGGTASASDSGRPRGSSSSVNPSLSSALSTYMSNRQPSLAALTFCGGHVSALR